VTVCLFCCLFLGPFCMRYAAIDGQFANVSLLDLSPQGHHCERRDNKSILPSAGAPSF
jgi:hypothetical protein